MVQKKFPCAETVRKNVPHEGALKKVFPLLANPGKLSKGTNCKPTCLYYLFFQRTRHKGRETHHSDPHALLGLRA